MSYLVAAAVIALLCRLLPASLLDSVQVLSLLPVEILCVPARLGRLFFACITFQSVLSSF